MGKKRGNLLLIGALFGFIIGLFIAPKKGSDLRKEAKEKIEEIKENPKDVFQETLYNVKDKINGFIDDNVEDNKIHISEDEIIISKSFKREGESN